MAIFSFLLLSIRKAGALAMAVGLIVITVPLGLAASSGPSQVMQACSPSLQNPVINNSMPFFINSSTGRFFAYGYSYYQPFVMRNRTGYTMWLTVEHQNSSLVTQGIYTANSADGVHWAINPSPLLTNGAKGSWDSGTVYSPWVVWNGTMYLMYFTGVNSTVTSRSIGVAFSRDNVHWTEYPGNPIVKGGPGAYDAYWARFPSVIYENGTYKMWYTGHTLITSKGLNVTIDYATSADGIHWAKYASNPVLKVYYSSGFYFSERGSVIRVGGGYVMTWDDEQNISYAYSSDGITWTGGPYPLLRSPASGAWSNNSVIFSDPLLNGSELLLLYSGEGAPKQQYSYTPYTGGIGLAYCPMVIVQTVDSTTILRTTTFVSTATVVSVSATTFQTTAQEVVGSSDLPYYQASLVGLGAVAVVLAVLAMRGRRPGP
ncbi:MAG: hypothetical protein KGI38_07500 [Thaumarchaeota archaeon]|nr:hypothetical protein [Nitrososphaerota archaeon]